MKEFDGANHGPWCIHIFAEGPDTGWRVYRLLDKDYPDVPFNREFAGPMFGSEQEARIWLAVNKEVLQW